jgi:nicotinate-nucleotide adenylyltransferase
VPKKIGLLGGSFNPVHQGHLALAKLAFRKMGLERVYFIPARISPFKTARPPESIRRRLKALRQILKPYPQFKICLREIKKPGTSYSYETAQYFRFKFPRHEIYWIMGSDAWDGFFKWRNWQKILKTLRLAVAQRQGSPTINPAPPVWKNKVIFLPGRLPKISSSQLRAGKIKVG